MLNNSLNVWETIEETLNSVRNSPKNLPWLWMAVTSKRVSKISLILISRLQPKSSKRKNIWPSKNILKSRMDFNRLSGTMNSSNMTLTRTISTRALPAFQLRTFAVLFLSLCHLENSTVISSESKTPPNWKISMSLLSNIWRFSTSCKTLKKWKSMLITTGSLTKPISHQWWERLKNNGRRITEKSYQLRLVMSKLMLFSQFWTLMETASLTTMKLLAFSKKDKAWVKARKKTSKTHW